MTHSIHKRWLKFAAVVVGSFGPLYFLGSMAETAEPIRWSMDLLSWPLDGFPTYTSSEMQFLSALTGGFLFGWGVTIWCLSVWVYDAAPEGVRRSVLSGLIAWFLLDSAGSIASGFSINVVFNTVLLLVAVGPLWRPARPD